MPKAIVAIPVYKPKYSEYEKVSFVQCCKILGEHPFSIICPDNLDIGHYEKILKQYKINYKTERFPSRCFVSVRKYSDLLLNSAFYQRFSDYKCVLLYQLDAFVFRDDLNYWCDQNYDYIGAPWFEGFSLAVADSKLLDMAGNGGFSLRKVASFIKVLSAEGKDQKLIKEFVEGQQNEDLFFSEHAKKIDSSFNVAPPKVAMHFSFECLPGKLYEMTGQKLPFGCHAWERYSPEFWEQFIDLRSVDLKSEFKLVRSTLNMAFGQLDLRQSQIDSIKNALASTEKRLNLTRYKLEKTETKIGSTKSQIESIHASLELAKSRMEKDKRDLDSTKAELSTTKDELSTTKNRLDSTQTKLGRIYASREWWLVLKLQKIVKTIVPVGSARRKFLIGSWRILKTSLRLARKLKGKLMFFKSYLCKTLKPKKPRKINLNSKKIVYIGHSYHNKTKSTVFLTDYLKQSYDMMVISDDSWQGKPFPDLSFIDESYLGVIFFQNLPDLKTLAKIKNDNLIFFPMYDAVGGLDFSWWMQYENLKIANFSKTLHEKLKKWGFESMHVQYFPDIQKFIPGERDEVFFWQRLTKININTITKLFKNDNVKIHIHRGIDPNHKFVQPSKEDEKKYKITYTDWFESRDEMLEKIGGLINQKGIYIAPREFEGIGHSFLEAMAMGKAVIAVNNPTMNEYIEHGKTGYLFDLSKPKKVDLSNIKQVQKNAYEFMQEGQKKWEKDKEMIIDFIKKS